jgi:hypothetical protein
MEMQDFVEAFALPLLRKRKNASVCEIGSRFGGSANLLASIPDGAVTIIDPGLDCDLTEKFKNNSRVTVKRAISLAVLPHMSGAFDLILVDGDHNWYTVYNELKLIYERGLLKNNGLIFLHDIDWPWGRRDLYYQPETIPAEFRHEWERGGIARGRSELLKNGGMFASYQKATLEGGSRNGVLTAVEDFLCEHKGEFGFVRVREDVGLGIVYRNGSAVFSVKYKGYFRNLVTAPKWLPRTLFPKVYARAKTLLRGQPRNDRSKP